MDNVNDDYDEFSINLKFTKIKHKRITYRDVKSIDLPRFVSYIKTEISSFTCICPVLLNSILLDNINIHAHTKTTLITDRHFYTWLSHEMFIFKKSVLKFEKKFLKHPSTETKLARKNCIFALRNNCFQITYRLINKNKLCKNLKALFVRVIRTKKLLALVLLTQYFLT